MTSVEDNCTPLVLALSAHLTEHDNIERSATLWKEWGVFEGKKFHAEWYNTSQTTGNVLYMLFKTPSTNSICLWVDLYSKTGCSLTLNESVTWTHTATNQTCVNIICDRRVNAQTSGILNKHAQTTFNAGSKIGVGTPQSLVNTTEIFRDYVLGSNQPTSTLPDNGDFFILAKDTLYSVVATTLNPGNATMVRLRWYEFNFDQ